MACSNNGVVVHFVAWIDTQDGHYAILCLGYGKGASSNIVVVIHVIVSVATWDRH